MANNDRLPQFDRAKIKTPIGFFSTLFRLMRVNEEFALPAIVKKYDRSTGIVTVQPIVSNVADDLNNKEIEIPRNEYDVRVVRFAHGGYVIDAPLFVGDTGWIVAGDRNSKTAIEKNSTVLEEDQTEGNSPNEGSQKPDDYSLKSFAWGFFIPDSWGVIDFDEDDGLVVSGKKISVKADEASVECGDNSASIDTESIDFHTENCDASINSESASVYFGSYKATISDSGTSVEGRNDKVTIDDDGLHHEGTVDAEYPVVSEVKYDEEIGKLIKKSILVSKRGDFVVGIDDETEWEEIDLPKFLELVYATASATTLPAGSSATASVTVTASEEGGPNDTFNFLFGIPKGDKGEDGDDGDDGVGISSIVSGDSSIVGDTTVTPVTVTLTNNTTQNLSVVAQNGNDGAPGVNGDSVYVKSSSTSSAPGGTSTVVLHDERTDSDTTISVTNGTNGTNGTDGDSVYVKSSSSSSEPGGTSTVVLHDEKTDTDVSLSAKNGTNGTNGSPGSPGVGISSVVSGESYTSGNTTVTPVTVTLTNNTTQNLDIVAQNGADGADGTDGTDGTDGASVTGATSGPATIGTTTTTTPITFQLSNGDTVGPVNVVAKNGSDATAPVQSVDGSSERATGDASSRDIVPTDTDGDVVLKVNKDKVDLLDVAQIFSAAKTMGVNIALNFRCGSATDYVTVRGGGTSGAPGFLVLAKGVNSADSAILAALFNSSNSHVTVVALGSSTQDSARLRVSPSGDTALAIATVGWVKGLIPSVPVQSVDGSTVRADASDGKDIVPDSTTGDVVLKVNRAKIVTISDTQSITGTKTFSDARLTASPDGSEARSVVDVGYVDALKRTLSEGTGISISQSGTTITISATGSSGGTSGYTGTRTVLADVDYDETNKQLRRRYITEVWENGVLKTQTLGSWESYHQAVEETV